MVLPVWLTNQQSAADPSIRSWSLSELLTAKQHDLHWRQESMNAYAQASRADPYRIRQVQRGIVLDEAILTRLQQLNHEFLVPGLSDACVLSYDVIADDLRLLKLDPQLGFLDVSIQLGNPGTERARLVLKLLGGC